MCVLLSVCFGVCALVCVCVCLSASCSFPQLTQHKAEMSSNGNDYVDQATTPGTATPRGAKKWESSLLNFSVLHIFVHCFLARSIFDLGLALSLYFVWGVYTTCQRCYAERYASHALIKTHVRAYMRDKLAALYASLIS